MLCMDVVGHSHPLEPCVHGLNPGPASDNFITCYHGFEVPASNGNHRIMFSRLGVWTGAKRYAGLVENETKDTSGQNNQRGETRS